jgi:hypothetical protein
MKSTRPLIQIVGGEFLVCCVQVILSFMVSVVTRDPIVCSIRTVYSAIYSEISVAAVDFHRLVNGGGLSDHLEQSLLGTLLSLAFYLAFRFLDVGKTVSLLSAQIILFDHYFFTNATESTSFLVIPIALLLALVAQLGKHSLVLKMGLWLTSFGCCVISPYPLFDPVVFFSIYIVGNLMVPYKEDSPGPLNDGIVFLSKVFASFALLNVFYRIFEKVEEIRFLKTIHLRKWGVSVLANRAEDWRIYVCLLFISVILGNRSEGFLELLCDALLILGSRPAVWVGSGTGSDSAGRIMMRIRVVIYVAMILRISRTSLYVLTVIGLFGILVVSFMFVFHVI